ncbi:MAG TPA: hypothetical protein VFV38_13845 [Ktedonobacteraceae bacterium]|nr:hypothetical protein [Ktedonobacteraceae bacterium]
MGSPIALYTMQTWWMLFCQVIRRVLLARVTGAVLFLFVMLALFSISI